MQHPPPYEEGHQHSIYFASNTGQEVKTHSCLYLSPSSKNPQIEVPTSKCLQCFCKEVSNLVIRSMSGCTALGPNRIISCANFFLSIVIIALTSPPVNTNPQTTARRAAFALPCRWLVSSSCLLFSYGLSHHVVPFSWRSALHYEAWCPAYCLTISLFPLVLYLPCSFLTHHRTSYPVPWYLATGTVTL